MAFLDGVRGAAALYVVFFHAYMQLNWRHDGGGLSNRVRFLVWIFSGGGYGVATFIVLSGYCLMLPVARSGNGVLRGGTGAYLLRRCKRILPPYYAALLISGLMIALIPALSVHPACFADTATPITIENILSHLLLIQNVRIDWLLGIDPPAWSVAVEFQIYFLFPLLLLPVYRRSGALVTVLFAYAIALIFSSLTHNKFNYSEPHFLGLFALGMLAADVTAGHGIEVQRLRKIPWQFIMGASLFIALLLMVINPRWAPRSSWTPHTFFGVATTAMFISCGLKRSAGKIIRRFFEASWLMRLSTFSYSLYLLHMPLEGLLFLPVRTWIHSPDLQLAVNFVVIVPTVCLLAYAFYWLFERPFTKPSKEITTSDSIARVV